MKVDMKNTDYYKSGAHRENYLKAVKLGIAACKRKKIERIEKYNKNPTICKQCDNSISYEKRNNKFCSSKCAGKFNNAKRKSAGWRPSVEQKLKTSASLTGSKHNYP